MIIFILSCLYTINYSLFIKFGLSIKSFTRSRFKDLKANPITRELAACYYTDWYSSKDEAYIISSIVYNIEEYCIRGLTSSALLWILIFTNSNLQNKNTSTTSGYINESIIASKTNHLFNNSFPSLLIDINKIATPIDSELKKEYTDKPEKLKNKNRSEITKLSHHAHRYQKQKKINVKIIDNNTVLIKYKD